MELCTSEKKQLIEEVGLHLEQSHHLPPLASRIYALMILSNHEGFSFEELIDITQASKSSVSTNINLLVQLGYIEYYTKPGDRKRYFRGTGNYLMGVLKEYDQAVDKELQIVQKVNAFKRTHNAESFIADKSIGVLFQEYLSQHKKSLTDTLQKMSAFQKESKDQ